MHSSIIQISLLYLIFPHSPSKQDLHFLISAPVFFLSSPSTHTLKSPPFLPYLSLPYPVSKTRLKSHCVGTSLLTLTTALLVILPVIVIISVIFLTCLILLHYLCYYLELLFNFLCYVCLEFPPVNPLSYCNKKERGLGLKVRILPKFESLFQKWGSGMSPQMSHSDFWSCNFITCKLKIIISALNTSSDGGESLHNVVSYANISGCYYITPFA